MKHLLALILCLSLLALCACGQAEPEQPTTPQPTIITTTAPTITDSPATRPIEYPASYKDAPGAYWPILDDLYKSVYILSNNLLDMADDLWGATEIQDVPGFAFDGDEFRHNTVGYAVKDI